MTIISKGYPSTFAPGSVWAEMQYALGNRYYVDDPSSAVCTPQVAGTRQVQIGTGRLGGWGIADQITVAEVLQLPTVASGTRWFLICARRTWGVANATSLVVLDPGWTSAPTTLPVAGTADTAYNNQPGTRDDQPLFVVSLTAGQTVPAVAMDIRLIGSGNDFLARHDLVRQYAAWAGLRITIGKVVWRRLLNDAGSALVWDVEASPFGSVSGLVSVSLASMMTISAGWSFYTPANVAMINQAYKYGNMVDISVNVRRTGTKITPGTDGNYSDIQGNVGVLVAGWRPKFDRRLMAQVAGASDTRTSGLGALGGQAYISRAGSVTVASGPVPPFGINQNLQEGLASVAVSDTYLFAA